MSDLGKAVFLSYASQDADAAKRICEALRAAGLEVWFDQSELRGGDAWDAKIRKQIKECALFVPVISANTNSRPEGYFRLEWKLAVDRSHLLADDHPFLFPVVIDDTADTTARVPEKFRDVQWTRLSVKDTPETLAVRVGKLLGGGPPEARGQGAEVRGQRSDGFSRSKAQPSWLRYAWAGVGIVFGLVYAVRPLFQMERRAEPKTAVSATTQDTNPRTPDPKLSEARQLAYQARALIDGLDSTSDDYATAEGLLKRALELDQNDGEVWALSSRLNSLYLSRGWSIGGGNARAEAARSQSERALKLAPDSVESLLAVARANRNTDAPRAEAALRQALVRAPNSGPVLLNLGSLYRVQNRLDEAMTYYERAAAVPEVRSLALYDQFLVSFYRRKFADADRYVRDSIAVVPTTNSVTGLAMVELTWRGQPEAALRVLAAAPGKVHNEPRSVIVTVLAAQMNRQPEEALAALHRFPAEYVNDAWYTGPKALLVGLCEAQAGRAEAARVAWESGIALLQRRLQDAPNNTNEHLRLGELLAWSGQTEAALREVKIFEELTSGRDTDWTFSASRIYAALGRADKAVPLLEQELRAPPSGRWPLTPALLRLDPLWDKLRADPRFQQLCQEPAAPAPPSALTEAGKLAARAVELYSKSNYTRDDLATAEDLARKATELEPDSAAAWGVRAGVHATYLSRNWDVTEKRRLEIQSATSRALGLNPNEPEALLARGRLLTVQGPAAWLQAEAALRQAVAVRPTDNRYVRALAFFYGFTGRIEEERVILNEVLQRGSRDPLVHYDLAMSYANYGSNVASLAKVTAALEHLDAGIAVQPLGSLLLLKAALVAAYYGDLTTMRAQLDQLEQLPLSERVEDRAVFIALWGSLLERKPERVAAAAALTAKNYFEDTVVAYRPKDWALALAHQIEGKANLAKLDWQRAESVLRQRGRDDPNNQIYTIELAITLAWLGRTDEAARELAPIEAAWREELTVQRARRLAHFYGATGEAGKAAPYLQRALNSGTFFMTHTVRLDPWWDKLRGQPEFEALLKESEAKK
jgi:tetratricopeptide (TPR) repeat protein